MQAATHIGHCQVCGNKQMLPGGKLSKHGYTKRWGFFDGTCTGAEALPFEQDISLIQAAIDRAKAQAAALRETAAKREAMTDPSDVYHEAYKFNWGNRFDRGYKVLHGRIEKDGNKTIFTSKLPAYRGEQYQEDLNQFGSLEATAAMLNEQEAWRNRQRAEQIDKYIRWQQGRIKNWKPSPLIERATAAT